MSFVVELEPEKDEPLNEFELGERPPGPSVVEKKPPRLHHLDWLRAFMIVAAVFLHVVQVFMTERPVIQIDNMAFPTFENASSPEFLVLTQSNPDWRNTDYTYRYIMMGRQFAIPLLFWISGASLGLGKGGLQGSMVKIAVITAVGCLSNGILWVLGPGDDRCSYWASVGELQDQCKGFLFDFVAAPGAGAIFGVLFQFWFTLFMLIFLLECSMLWDALRDVHDTVGASGEFVFPPKFPPKVYSHIGCHFASVLALYLILSQWIDEENPPNKTLHALYVGFMELPFIACLMLAAMLPDTMPSFVRLAQYGAAIIALFQFCLLEIPGVDLGGPDPPLDGRYIIYFHIFRQFMSLGYIMTLTRAKTGPIISRAYPIAFIMLVLTGPCTNYYRGGVDTYPWFPHFIDRFLYTGGGLMQLFVHDRLGNVFADTGLSIPVPRALGLGALMAYLFHPVAILCLARFFAGLHTFIATLVTVAIFCGIAQVITMATAKKR